MKMRYTVLGTNNMDAAVAFYNSLFENTAPHQVFDMQRMMFWQFEDFAFAVATPFDGQPATHGNGTMIGFDVESNDEVKRLHKKAIALGGSCEGEPSQKGPRFSGYVRDLDQNKICFYH